MILILFLMVMMKREMIMTKEIVKILMIIGMDFASDNDDGDDDNNNNRQVILK